MSAAIYATVDRQLRYLPIRCCSQLGRSSNRDYHLTLSPRQSTRQECIHSGLQLHGQYMFPVSKMEAMDWSSTAASAMNLGIARIAEFFCKSAARQHRSSDGLLATVDSHLTIITTLEYPTDICTCSCSSSLYGCRHTLHVKEDGPVSCVVVPAHLENGTSFSFGGCAVAVIVVSVCDYPLLE